MVDAKPEWVPEMLQFKHLCILSIVYSQVQQLTTFADASVNVQYVQ